MIWIAILAWYAVGLVTMSIAAYVETRSTGIVIKRGDLFSLPLFGPVFPIIFFTIIISDKLLRSLRLGDNVKWLDRVAEKRVIK